MICLAHEIHCDVLFDGEKLVEHAKVRVDGAVVSEVVAGSEPLDPGESAADVLRTKFLMPGLIDAHVHVTGYVEGLPAGVPFQPMKHFARLCIYNGVTAVRDTGNSLETLFYLREWTEEFRGPRVFGSGPLLDSPPLTWPFSRIVRDEAAAQREVARLAFEGVDLIKAYRHIGPGLLATIVTAASEHGLPGRRQPTDLSATRKCRRRAQHRAHDKRAPRLRADRRPERHRRHRRSRARVERSRRPVGSSSRLGRYPGRQWHLRRSFQPCPCSGAGR